VDFAFSLLDRMSGPLGKIDKAMRPLPKGLKGVKKELDALERMEKLDAIKKAEAPWKKRKLALELFKADLEKGQAQQEAYTDANTKAFGAIAGGAATAALAVVGLGLKLASTISARELYKTTERKLSFAFGKDLAPEEQGIVRRIQDVTTESQDAIVEKLIKLKNLGFDRRASENILTVAEDARSAGEGASEAVMKAFSDIKKSQNNLENFGKGAFGAGDFDSLVESGAIDRTKFLDDIAAQYKVSQNQAIRMVNAGLIRGDVAQEAITRGLRDRFDKGGAVGTEAKDRGSKSLDVSVNKLKNRALDIFSKVDTQPILDVVNKISLAFDPNSPRVAKFMGLLTRGFSTVSAIFDRLSSGTDGDMLGKAFDFILDRSTAFFGFIDKAIGVWDATVAPAFTRFGTALQPVIDKLGLAGGSSGDIDLLSRALSFWGKGLGTTIDIITAFVKAIDWMITKVSAAKDIGSSLVKGISGGIDSQGGLLRTAVGAGIGDTIIKTLKDKLEIHSPSRVMFRLGAHTAQGFSDGIDKVGTPNIAMPGIPAITAPSSSASSGEGRASSAPNIGELHMHFEIPSGGPAGAAPATNSGDFAAQVGDVVRNEVLRFFEDIGYEVGAG
jgi:hypothetical protein